MTEEEREELERLREERDRQELEYYREENRLRKAYIKRENQKRLLLRIELISIAVAILVMILALTIIPKITKSITVDIDGDGFYEPKRVFTWQVDDYEEYMYKSPW